MTIGNEHTDASHIFLLDKGPSRSLVSSHLPSFQQSPVSYAIESLQACAVFNLDGNM